MFLSFCVLLAFFTRARTTATSAAKNILSAGILDSVFMLFAIEMECIVRLGRCSAERISVFDYLHKISNKNREKKEAACHGAATTGSFFLSAPSNLLFPFCCSLGSFFVCFFSFGGISSGIFTFLLYSLAHFVII